MSRVFNFAAAVLLVVGVASVPRSTKGMVFPAADDAGAGRPTQRASLQPASTSSSDIPFKYVDSEAEQTLLELTNQARAQAGLRALTLDPGLTNAARVHAEAMFQARQLSHHFEGEASLPARLAAATGIQLDQEGENVAFDYSAAEGHAHLMLSPPHRENLLNPGYNVIGLGVVRGEGRLYIVEDFGHALPSYSVAQMKGAIAARVVQARRQFKRPALARRDLPTADDAACSMARADQLSTAPISQLAQRYIVLSYTSLNPGTLPDSSAEVLSNRNLRDFSVGACYARTQTYPTGVYWIVLSLE
jgi:uncharacterized protein YkwD